MNDCYPGVPDHELIRVIGRGSYGEVWLARHRMLGALRAVKIVSRQTFDADRPFQREFEGVRNTEAISRSHPGLVDILSVGGGVDFFYYIMELADPAPGRYDSASTRELKTETVTADPLLGYAPKTLRSEIHRCGRIPMDRCLEIGSQLAQALQHLHDQALVHRDMKPSNVVFAGGIPKLADVGLVTSLGETRSFVGTDGYVPPEGPGTPGADLFSLGRVLYRMATGKDPGDYPDPLIIEDDPVLQDRWFELSAVIHRACDPDPPRRYQSASDMTADLFRVQRGFSVRRRQRWMARGRLLRRAAVGVATIVAAGWFLIPLTDWRPASPPPDRMDDESYPPDPVALALYEEAANHHPYTRAGVAQGIPLLQEAIRVDPQFIDPYIRAAHYYLQASAFYLRPRIALGNVRQYAEAALRIDPDHAEALVLLAKAPWKLDYDLRSAEAILRQALAIDPDAFMSRCHHYKLLRTEGRFAEARAIMDAINSWPSSSQRTEAYAVLSFMERDFQETRAWCAELRSPHTIIGQILQAAIHGAEGEYESAAEILLQALQQEMTPDLLGYLGFVEARRGRADEAERILRDLDEIEGFAYVDPYFKAHIFAGLDDTREVLRHLNRAYEDRSPKLLNALDTGLHNDFRWDHIRDEPGFQELIRRTGIPWHGNRVRLTATSAEKSAPNR